MSGKTSALRKLARARILSAEAEMLRAEAEAELGAEEQPDSPSPFISEGPALRAWRGDRTQAEVGGLLDVDQSTMARLESGKQEPRISLALRIERVTLGAVPASLWAIAND